MAAPDLRSLPRPKDAWLSRPPFLMVARIVAVDLEADPASVSYRLHDADGSLLQEVEDARLDRDWWRTFQPLARRYG
jgi:hypothetical protein